MSLPSVLKQTRQKLFMTQEDFASAINVSAVTINRWEKGHSKPNMTAMKNIKAFCSTNNLPFDEIEKEWINHHGGQNDE